MNFKLKITCILIIFYSVSSYSQVNTELVSVDRLNKYLTALQNDPALLNANWSFCLTDPETHNIITSYEKNRSLIPASGMKAITTLSALAILGENYHYKTSLEYDSLISNGIILGNLYITGSGDPSLGSNRSQGFHRFDTLMNDWALILKKKGIKKISGKIISDASAFEEYSIPGSWNWDDIGQYYGAGPYGLNIYENTFTIYYSSGKTKSKVDSIYPDIEGLTIYNDVKVAGSGDDAYIFGAPDNYFRYVTGTIPANRKQFTVDGSMPDPPLFLAVELKKALIKNGIEVVGNATTNFAMNRIGLKMKGNRKPLYEHLSPPLSEIIHQTDLHSINLYAEALLKTLGKEQLNDGSTSSGIKVIRNYWTEKGLNLTGLIMEDGSGLSRLNVIPTSLMCQFLSEAYQMKNFETYKNSMAIAGEAGTLKSIGKGTSAQGKIFAKSGSMSKVRSYSGYVKSQSGKLYCFSIIMNNYTCSSSEIKQKLETLMIRMAELS